MDAKATKRAYKLLQDPAFGTSKSVARELHRLGHTARVLHRTTVVRAVGKKFCHRGERLRAVRGKPGQLLGETTANKRLAFALEQASTPWDRVMFTDRKRFYFRFPACKVKRVQWVREGEKRRATVANNPRCYNVYCGLTVHGCTAVHVVAGTNGEKGKGAKVYYTKAGTKARNITLDEYEDVLQQTLLPEGERLLGRKRGAWYLQQDNDPAHNDAERVVGEWRKEKRSRVELLAPWPPCSPDLSPIENVWGMVMARVEAKGSPTLEDFKLAVQQELQTLPQATVTNLFNSMKSRLAAVLAEGGQRTGY
jgi:hypothetical protein